MGWLKQPSLSSIFPLFSTNTQFLFAPGVLGPPHRWSSMTLHLLASRDLVPQLAGRDALENPPRPVNPPNALMFSQSQQANACPPTLAPSE